MPMDETAVAPFQSGRWLLSHNGLTRQMAVDRSPTDAQGAGDLCQRMLLRVVHLTSERDFGRRHARRASARAASGGRGGQPGQRALADEIAAISPRRPIVIVADLAAPGAAQKIADELRAHGAEPNYVVNNAGFGLTGLFGTRDRDETLQMIDLNVRTLTELSLAFVDSLARHKGGLLNVGSVAGFLPGPGMAVYYATKAYVLSFSEALHSEFKARGIRVTVLCPGPVPTEFAERAGVSGPGHAEPDTGADPASPRRRGRLRARSRSPASPQPAPAAEPSG